MRVSDERLAEIKSLPVTKEVLDIIADLQDARTEIARLKQCQPVSNYFPNYQKPVEGYIDTNVPDFTIQLSNHTGNKEREQA